MDCPACAHPNPPDAHFCGSCGASLLASVRCAACGTENPGGQRFCNACGHELVTMPEPPSGIPEHLARKIRDSHITEGERKQVIQFNPTAALQKGIFADGFVPNSAEFTISVGGTPHAAQRAEDRAGRR